LIARRDRTLGLLLPPRFDAAAAAGEHILRELASAMADDGAELPPPAKKKSPAEEAAEKRRKKLTPGSLMKGLLRSGSGDATPVDGDQVTTSTCNLPFLLINALSMLTKLVLMVK